MSAPGIEIVSREENTASQAFRFRILEDQKEDALRSLIAYLDGGYTITVSDNRDSREGFLSFKFEAGSYFKSGGGHGFSIPWSPIVKKDLLWLLKVTAHYNLVQNEIAIAEMQLTSRSKLTPKNGAV